MRERDLERQYIEVRADDNIQHAQCTVDVQSVTHFSDTRSFITHLLS